MPNPFQQLGSMDQDTTPETESAPIIQAGIPGTQPPDMSKYDDAVNQARSRLHGILTQLPNVDFEAKYQEIINDVKNRPVDKMPNPLTSFAYAFGAPKTAPGILHEKVMRSQAQADQKEFDMMKLKETMLQGAIQQEIAQGNFKTALSQSEKLMELQDAVNTRDRARNMSDWMERQRVKTADAEKLVRARAAQIAQSFHLDEKMQMLIYSKMMDGVRSMQGKTNPLTGEPMMDDYSIMSTMDSMSPMMLEYAKSLATTGKAPASGPTAKEKPKSKLQQNYDSMYGN